MARPSPTMKTIRALLLAAMHRWRIAAYGFEDEDDVARMVAAQFGQERA